MKHVKTTIMLLSNGTSQRICIPFKEIQEQWAHARVTESHTMEFPMGVERDNLDYEVRTDAIIAIQVGIEIRVTD